MDDLARYDNLLKLDIEVMDMLEFKSTRINPKTGAKFISHPIEANVRTGRDLKLNEKDFGALENMKRLQLDARNSLLLPLLYPYRTEVVRSRFIKEYSISCEWSSIERDAFATLRETFRDDYVHLARALRTKLPSMVCDT